MDIECNEECNEYKLNSCLFFLTTKLAREFGKLADDAFSKTGLSPSHAILLYTINLKNGIQQKELSETLHLTPSTITRLLDKLERKSYIEKQSEGKNVYIKTTTEGINQQEGIISSWNKLHNSYKDILTEEETLKLLEISNKLIRNLGNNKI